MFHHRPLPLVAALALAAGIQLIAAEQVELHLKSGQVVKGEVVSEDDAQIVLKTVFVGKTGTMTANLTYKRPDIDEVVRKGDPEVDYVKRSAAATSAADHAGLASWCRDQAMTERAIDQAQKAVALSPDQEEAVKVLTDLGWVKVDGKWVKESDWLASQGKVRLQGRIMTLAEADAFKAEQKQQHAAQDAQKAVDEKTARVATIDRQLADLQKRPEQIDAELAKDNAALATAQSAAQRVATARTAMDAAQASLANAQSQANVATGGPGAAAAAANVATLSQASENAQKVYSTAKREAAGAEQDVARLKGHIATLTEERKNADKKRDELNARRATAVKELEAAKTALADLAKKAAAAPPAAPTPAPAAP